jgi:RNA polymerase sigma-70 factor (ECF subfamily)
MKNAVADGPSSRVDARAAGGRAALPPIDAPGRDGGTLADLIAASARGDERAFRRLYQASSGVLFGMALRVLKRRDWAEEVLQESFVSVWRHAARYDRNKGAAMTWLIRIVRNQAFDWIHPSRPDGYERRFARAADLPGDELIDAADAGNTQHGPELLDCARRAERVAACLDALDARQRQSVALVFFHGLSHADLARQLRQPLGTVKAWVRRGLARLAVCLGGLGA